MGNHYGGLKWSGILLFMILEAKSHETVNSIFESLVARKIEKRSTKLKQAFPVEMKMA